MHIYASADRSSEVITTVSRGSQDETSILIIDPEEPIDNGYYRVRLPSGPGYGYIYRTAGRVYEDFGGPYKPYNRSAYKHWVDADRDCENTRDEVLIRDAVGKVETTHGASRCRVTGGTWTDPYSGTTLSDPSKIDVDHMVPLKNAHNSGAWAWSAQRKQDYANFLDDPVHLIAVSASENRRKGDKGPDRYLPPSTDYQCQYVQDWLDVKYAWGLNIPDSERAAVDSVLRECPAITGGGLTQ
jgi:hypothetical protein